jgi:general secretion pathway protein G
MNTHDTLRPPLPRTAARVSERGLTLVEIMIVLTIMASIMGIVGFVAAGAITNSRIKEAETEVSQLAQAVTAFWVMRQEYPDSLEQLADPPSGMAPILEKVPEDPWGNEYHYSQDNNGFTIACGGPDGSLGGGDDICPANQDCN